MKTLYVIRHAKSSWDNPLLADADRPLNARGEADAPRMGKRLNNRTVRPNLMVSSPALRAWDTCTAIAKVIDYPLSNIKKNKNLYHAQDDEILSIVQHFDNALDSVWILGHNPGLTDFVNQLTDESIDNIPTCGVVACSLAIQRWDEADWKKGTVLYFDYPKKKDSKP
jgi:phosphohistidine phosphatase